MTRTQGHLAGTPARRPATRTERLIVLGGFIVAALWTAVAAILGAGIETVGAAWLAAVLWTVPSSLALALRRGFVHRDWSAFGRSPLSDGRDERMDWASKTGRYAYLRVAEEHRRLTLGY